MFFSDPTTKGLNPTNSQIRYFFPKGTNFVHAFACNIIAMTHAPDANSLVEDEPRGLLKHAQRGVHQVPQRVRKGNYRHGTHSRW